MGKRICLVAVAVAGCHLQPAPGVPGQTQVVVSKVEIAPRAGERLDGEYEPLMANLGLRGKNLVFPERTFNEYRLAEDRRRVLAYLQAHGRFDAEVDVAQGLHRPLLRRVLYAEVRDFNESRRHGMKRF